MPIGVYERSDSQRKADGDRLRAAGYAVTYEQRCRGIDHHKAVLDDDKVREIRRLYAEGKGIRELGRLFQCTHGNIRAIVIRQTWTHI